MQQGRRQWRNNLLGEKGVDVTRVGRKIKHWLLRAHILIERENDAGDPAIHVQRQLFGVGGVKFQASAAECKLLDIGGAPLKHGIIEKNRPALRDQARQALNIGQHTRGQNQVAVCRVLGDFSKKFEDQLTAGQHGQVLIFQHMKVVEHKREGSGRSSYQQGGLTKQLGERLGRGASKALEQFGHARHIRLGARHHIIKKLTRVAVSAVERVPSYWQHGLPRPLCERSGFTPPSQRRNCYNLLARNGLFESFE